MTTLTTPPISGEIDKPFHIMWLVSAPWAHPAWSNYVVYVQDLKPRIDDKEGGPVVFFQGATHEIDLLALDPGMPRPPKEYFGSQPVTDWDTLVRLHQPATCQINVLAPPNHIYQFIAADNEAAQKRVQWIVDEIIACRLNPDTDFIKVWDELFKDGMSARRAVRAD